MVAPSADHGSRSRSSGPRGAAMLAIGRRSRSNSRATASLSSGFTRLARPVTLARLRGAKDAMVTAGRGGTAAGYQPLYFPFELGSRDLRPMQGYAFKLPASFLELFPSSRGAKSWPPAHQARRSAIHLGTVTS